MPPRTGRRSSGRCSAPSPHVLSLTSIVVERQTAGSTYGCSADPLGLPAGLPGASPTPELAAGVRDAGSWSMRTLAADLRYAFRTILRAPSFAAAVIAVLALGIAANVAIFSIVNTVLLRPLPFEAPDRLVRLFHIPPQETFPGIPRFSVSPANFYDWKRDAQLFESMAIYRFRRFTLTDGGRGLSVTAGALGADFFEVVGARPQAGRLFHDDEDAPGRSRVAIVSDGFWKRHFGSSADAVGRTLRLD